MVLLKYIEENILRPLSDSERLPDFTFGQNLRNYKHKRHDNIIEGYAGWAAVYGTQEQMLFQLEEKTLKPLFGDLRNKAVLDIGCGTGRYSIYFARNGAEVTGVDLTPEMIAVARRKAIESNLDIDFIISDVLDVDLKLNEFDLIFSSLAVTHIRNLSALFGKLQSVLRQNGRIWISEIHPILKMLGANVGYVNGDEFLEIPHYIHRASDFCIAAAENDLEIERLLEFPTLAVAPFMMAIALTK